MPEKTVSASLVFGSGIHRAIERHFQEQLAGNPIPTLKELVAAYESEWTDRGEELRLIDQNERTALTGTAERMLTAFQAHEMARPAGRILVVEETLRGPVIPGLPDLLGRVDLIVEERDALVIHDWKTSVPVLTKIKTWLNTEQEAVLPRSPIAAAITYAQKSMAGAHDVHHRGLPQH